MIELTRLPESPFADDIEEELQALVLAHKVHVIDPFESDQDDLPVVQEGRRTYRSRQEIETFLDELRGEVITGRELQSDSCVIDPDDPSQCL